MVTGMATHDGAATTGPRNTLHTALTRNRENPQSLAYSQPNLDQLCNTCCLPPTHILTDKSCRHPDPRTRTSTCRASLTTRGAWYPPGSCPTPALTTLPHRIGIGSSN